MGQARMYWTLYRKELRNIRGITAALIVLMMTALVINRGIFDPIINHFWELYVRPLYTNHQVPSHIPDIPYLSELSRVSFYLHMFIRSAGFMLPVILLYLFIHEGLTRGTLLGRALSVRRSGTVLCRVGAVMTAGIPIAFLQNYSRNEWNFISRPLNNWRLANGYNPEVIAYVTKWYNEHQPERLAGYLEKIETYKSFPIRQMIDGLFPFLKKTVFDLENLPRTGDTLIVYLLLCAVVVASVGIGHRFQARRVFAGIVSALVILGLFPLLADPVFTDIPVHWYTAGELKMYYAVWTVILLAAGTALIARYGEE